MKGTPQHCLFASVNNSRIKSTIPMVEIFNFMSKDKAKQALKLLKPSGEAFF